MFHSERLINIKYNTYKSVTTEESTCLSTIDKDYLHCMRLLVYELKTQLYWLRITKRPVYLLFDLLAQCTSLVASFHAKPNGDGVDIQGKWERVVGDTFQARVPRGALLPRMIVNVRP